jgi:hypothetical protein
MGAFEFSSDPVEKFAQIRDLIHDSLGLDLSDTEVNTLSSGEALSLKQLSQTRSLGELGAMLIRVDTLSRLPQTTAASSSTCPNGQHPICIPLSSLCFCSSSQGKDPILEFRLHQE